MAKRIAVCLDGTWNKKGQTDDGTETRTNVLKLFEALTKAPDQIAQYFPGVGTDPGEKVSGGAIGWGLFDQIKDGYRYLLDHFEPEDKIYIFGFSRGAYSARSLAGMILRCGILKREHANANLDVPKSLTDPLTTQQDGDARIDATDKLFAMYKHAYEEKHRADVEQFKQRFCHDTGVRLVGVWDTVGALGIPDGLVISPLRRLDKLLKRELFGFLDTTLSPRVEAGYHAVAIDEHRKPFAPTLWTDAPGAKPRINVPDSNVEQVWFTGAHSNVGGGYADSGLSDIALKWMLDRAQANELRFVSAINDILNPDPTAGRRDSLNEFLEIGNRENKNKILAWMDKTIDKAKNKFMSINRPIPDGSSVHESVGKRLAAKSAKEPGAIAAYQPAPTLKVEVQDGTRRIDPQRYRVVA